MDGRATLFTGSMASTKGLQKATRTPADFVVAAPDDEDVRRGVIKGRKRQITLTIMPELLAKVDAMVCRLGQSELPS